MIKCRRERKITWRMLYNLNVQLQFQELCHIILFTIVSLHENSLAVLYNNFHFPCVELFQINGHNSQWNKKLQNAFLSENFPLTFSYGFHFLNVHIELKHVLYVSVNILFWLAWTFIKKNSYYPWSNWFDTSAKNEP